MYLLLRSMFICVHFRRVFGTGSLCQARPAQIDIGMPARQQIGMTDG